MKNQIVIYQAKGGAIEFKGNFQKDTIWASLQQIADLFETDKSGISRHIKNIYDIGELDRKSTVAFFATVQNEGGRKIKRNIEYYDLDMILSVGYRVNSKKATIFRRWATKVLRKHILEGYTVNRRLISRNYRSFTKALEDVKRYLPVSDNLKTSDVLELVKMFASTWLSLDSYDKEGLPKSGSVKRRITVTSNELGEALLDLKTKLITQGNATNIFGQEKRTGETDSIIKNVFQSYGGKDLYPTLEEKAANLLYFFAKGHPFADGNKRSGAFAFVWFLRKAGILDTSKITPEALTAMTLLVAESNPKDKEKIVGLVLMLIKK